MMKSILVFSVLSAVALITAATLVSETVHQELTADVVARVKAMDMPEEHVSCIMREISNFPAEISEDGKKKYDIVAYRAHVNEALKNCLSDEMDDSISSIIRRRHWKKKKAICGCRSGCHFCCVAAVLGGSNLCFKVWCPKAPFCSSQIEDWSCCGL